MTISGVYLGKCDSCGKIEVVDTRYYPATRDEPDYTDFIDHKCKCGGTISADNMDELTPQEEMLLERAELFHEIQQIENWLCFKGDVLTEEQVKQAYERKTELWDRLEKLDEQAQEDKQ